MVAAVRSAQGVDQADQQHRDLPGAQVGESVAHLVPVHSANQPQE